MAKKKPHGWNTKNESWQWMESEAPKEPEEKTEALPGSDEKLDVMRRRLEEGRPIHSPDDYNYQIRDDFKDKEEDERTARGSTSIEDSGSEEDPGDEDQGFDELPETP